MNLDRRQVEKAAGELAEIASATAAGAGKYEADGSPELAVQAKI